MANIYGVPEVNVADVASLLEAQSDILLLDVREAMELNLANLGEDVLWVPLSKMAAQRLDALPIEMTRDKHVIVFCHTGVRSAQVAAWLRSEGWNEVFSMAGGIDAYAREIDSKVGRY